MAAVTRLLRGYPPCAAPSRLPDGVPLKRSTPNSDRSSPNASPAAVACSSTLAPWNAIGRTPHTAATADHTVYVTGVNNCPGVRSPIVVQ